MEIAVAVVLTAICMIIWSILALGLGVFIGKAIHRQEIYETLERDRMDRM